MLVKKRLAFTVLLRLFSAGIRREGEGRSSPERGRKQTLDLGFTKVCWRRTIRAFTMLCYFRVMFGSLCPVEVPESRRVWCASLFVSSEKIRDVTGAILKRVQSHLSRAGFNYRFRESAGFNSRCKGTMI